MSESKGRIKLPFRTNATQTGPIIEYQGSNLLVKYDHMAFNGEIIWVSVTLAEVLAYDVCEDSCCSADVIIPSDVIETLKESDWLTQIVGRWKETVGWQQYHQDLGGEKRFKHYVIYFDDVCAVQVIASSCSVHADE